MNDNEPGLSMDDFKAIVLAARTVRRANAVLGNGANAAWTTDDLFDLASSIALEYSVQGQCPMCDNEVDSTTSARIRSHRNKDGDQCPTSGHWFSIAVVSP